MTSFWAELFKFLGACVGLCTGIYVTYWQFRQKRIAKSHGLEDNPERCGRHEEALKTLKERVNDIDDKNDRDHERLFKELGLISVEVAKLGRNGNRGGGTV